MGQRGRSRIGPGESLPLVVVRVLKLAADLSRREEVAVDVDVDHAAADTLDDLQKLARSNPLSVADDVAGVDDAADSAFSGASLGAGRSVSQVRAEEDHDGAADRLLPEMKMRL